MGTEIHLKVGGISLCFSKNHMGIDFGHLFQECDRARRRMEEINYEYYEEIPDEIADLELREMAFAWTLERMVPRLDLLNHSLEAARAEYEAVVAGSLEMASYHEPPKEPSFLTFEEFCAQACPYPISVLKDAYVEYDTPERERVSQGRFANDADELGVRAANLDRCDILAAELRSFRKRLIHQFEDARHQSNELTGKLRVV